MSRISMKGREQLPELAPLLDLVESSMGFVPNSMLTMGHWPELLSAFGGLGGTVLQTGVVDSSLKQLIAVVSSRAQGCDYCQAHTAHSAHRAGAGQEKIAAVFDFEESPLFSDKEREALRFAWHASLQPNATDPASFDALSVFFGEREIVEIVAVISLFGFLNRWNDTFATELEPVAVNFGDDTLTEAGWSRGKH